MKRQATSYKRHRFPPQIIQHLGYGDTFFLDEVFVRIRGEQRYIGRAELSHQPTRVRERGMRRFSSPEQAQRFLSAHAVVYNLFNLQRHLASAAFYRLHRARAFERWNEAVAA